MKIVLSPIETIRTNAEREVDNLMKAVSSQDLHKDVEHARKRSLAEQFKQGILSEDFTAIAELEGTTPAILADIILSKPDEISARAIIRRRYVLAIRNAPTTADIATLLVEAREALGLPGDVKVYG